MALVFNCLPAGSQTVVSGVVREAKTKDPVAGAFVLGVAGSQQKAFAYSDEEGEFTLRVPDGVVLDEIRVSMMGFAAMKMRLPIF